MEKPEGGPSKLSPLQPSGHRQKNWALPADIQAALTKIFVGNPDRIFVRFFDRLYKKYGRNTPHDIKANSAGMRVA